MKKEIIKHLTSDFESYAKQTQNGVEFWFGGDLQHYWTILSGATSPKRKKGKNSL